MSSISFKICIKASVSDSTFRIGGKIRVFFCCSKYFNKAFSTLKYIQTALFAHRRTKVSTINNSLTWQRVSSQDFIFQNQNNNFKRKIHQLRQQSAMQAKNIHHKYPQTNKLQNTRSKHFRELGSEFLFVNSWNFYYIIMAPKMNNVNKNLH